MRRPKIRGRARRRFATPNPSHTMVRATCKPLKCGRCPSFKPNSTVAPCQTLIDMSDTVE